MAKSKQPIPEEKSFTLRIDWQELQHQKAALCAAAYGEPFRREDLHGLVHMLDFIQDDAVRQGLSEQKVFGKLQTKLKAAEPAPAAAASALPPDVRALLEEVRDLGGSMDWRVKTVMDWSQRAAWLLAQSTPSPSSGDAS